MRKKAKYIGWSWGIFCLMGNVSLAFADTLAEWSLITDGTPTQQSAQVQAGNFTFGSGLAGGSWGTSGVFANGWSLGDLNISDYFEISITPKSGYEIVISDIFFSERRSASGPRNYQVQVSTASTFSGIILKTETVPDNDLVRIGNITNTNIAVQEGETLRIRFFAYGAESAAGTWRIQANTLKILGIVSSTDTTSPTITSIISSPQKISSAQKTLITTITFSEVMKTTVSPLVKLQGLATQYTLTQTSFTGNVWTGTIEIADEDEEIWANYQMSLAQDFAGNIMLPNTANTILVDTKAPTGTISLNAGSVSNQTTQNINLTISDEGIGIVGAQMRFSCDATNWSAWENFATQKNNFNFFSGQNGCLPIEGTRQVFVQFKDALQNQSAPIASTSFVIDITPPTVSQITIFSSNTSDSTLAKTNDTITIEFTTNDNFSSTVQLRPGAHILSHAVIDGVSGNTGTKKTISRFTTGSEISEQIVPFAFQISDEAGNQSAWITSTNDGSTVKFDRTDPLVQKVSLSSSNLNQEFLPESYAKIGDTIFFQIEAKDYVSIAPLSGTCAGKPLTWHPATFLENAGNAAWYRYTGTTTFSAGDPEGRMACSVSVFDQAGNGPINIGGTTDGTSVILDFTAPTLPVLTDQKGLPTNIVKHRKNAIFFWNEVADSSHNAQIIPGVINTAEASGIWKYALRMQNQNQSTSQIGETHSEFMKKTTELATIAGQKKYEEAQWSSLSVDSSGRIPPRKDPYELQMKVLDRAGNISHAGTYQTVYEQKYTIGVSGTVSEKGALPIHGSFVEIVSRFGETCDTQQETCLQTTDSNGKYEILTHAPQEYEIFMWYPGFYRQQKRFQINNEDLEIKSELQRIENPREWQTAEKRMEIETVHTFLQNKKTEITKITIQTNSSDIKTEYDALTDILKITSFGRIFAISSNNPYVIIQDKGNNQYEIKNSGQVKLIRNSLGNDIQKNGNVRLGVISIPGSGRKNAQVPGRKKEEFEILTYEQSLAQAEKANQGYAGKVLQYKNENDFWVFGGYQAGQLPSHKIGKQYVDRIAFQGLKSIVSEKRKKEIEQFIYSKKEKAPAFPQKKTYSTKKPKTGEELFSVQTKKIYDKNKRDKFARWKKQDSPSDLQMQKAEQNKKTVKIFGTNGKSFSVETYLNGTRKK